MKFDQQTINEMRSLFTRQEMFHDKRANCLLAIINKHVHQKVDAGKKVLLTFKFI